MRTVHVEGRRPIHLWTDDVEASAMVQLENLSKLPFIHHHGVAAMPDVHMGYGSTVGSVIATVDAVIPAAVGVDIGCGMMAIRTNMRAEHLPDSLAELRHDIERGIPLGTGGAHTNIDVIERNYEKIELPESVTKVLKGKDPFIKAAKQLGSLGSGNHFIEICLDDAGSVWVMLHSGSRGIGNQIGTAYIGLAKLDMEKYFVTLPDKDLAYFPVGTKNFDDYVEAVSWAQGYALMNRERMMEAVMRAMQHTLKRKIDTDEVAVNCHHNYVELENHYGRNAYVTRKGAIRARQGDLGIIPGSMGTRSYIVRGKGNDASYHSCSHGAGRRMSRTEARKRFTVEDLVKQTEGVECAKVIGVVDEIPGAYKDIDQVMANQTDLVEVLFVLKQVMCIKGS